MAYLHRTSTGIGFKAFGPFLIPLLDLEICIKTKPSKIYSKCNIENDYGDGDANIVCKLSHSNHYTPLMIDTPAVKFNISGNPN